MRYLLLSAMLVFVSTARAAEHPQWASLAALHGQQKDSKEVVAFVQAHKLDEVTKGPSGSFTPDDNAYSLLYRDNRIKWIVIQASPVPKKYANANWRPYSKALPGGLSPKDGRKDVVKKLGKPTKPDQNRWNHRGLLIWVMFNKEKTAIRELFVSVQKKST